MKKNIYEIIVLKIASATNAQQEKRLNKWLKEKNNRLIFHALSKHMANENPDASQSKRKVFERISERIRQEPEELKDHAVARFRLPVGLRIAALLALVVGLSWIIFRNEDESILPIAKSIEVEKNNPKGQKSSFVLSDGTLVKLNADSRLIFLKKFTSTSREVLLEGEAFFDVKKDANRPFIVKSGDLITQALGTSFNVRAFPDESATKVALVSGRVKVACNTRCKENQQYAILNPSDAVTFNKRTQEILKGSFNQELELAWKNQTLHFKDADFTYMINNLERWYGVSFEIKKGTVVSTQFTGKFKDKSLEYVLNVLSQNGEYFSFQIEDSKIIITR